MSDRGQLILHIIPIDGSTQTNKKIADRVQKWLMTRPANIVDSEKGRFYIAQYPVRWTGQRALPLLPPLADLFIPTPTRLLREAFIARQQLRAKTKSLTFPPLSIARYAFIQLSEQGRQWRERKCPIFETVAKRDSSQPGLT